MIMPQTKCQIKHTQAKKSLMKILRHQNSINELTLCRPESRRHGTTVTYPENASDQISNQLDIQKLKNLRQKLTERWGET